MRIGKVIEFHAMMASILSELDKLCVDREGLDAVELDYCRSPQLDL